MATLYWTGAAQDVAQEDTITLGGTWTSSETATVTCNNKSVTITTGSSIDTTTEVAAALAHALQLTHHDSDQITAAGYDYTVNMGGYEVGEFRDMEFDVSGSVITVKSKTPGVPFTITVAEGSTSGTIALATGGSGASVVPTGKNWVDDANNWGGTAPSASDKTLILADSSVDILYGLDQLPSDATLRVYNSYTGHIGLPVVNNTHAGYPYYEYRQRHLDMPITATTGTVQVWLGERYASTEARGRRYIDFGTNTGSTKQLYVYDAQDFTDDGHAVQILGGKELDIEIQGGTVRLAGIQGSSMSIDTLRVGMATRPRGPLKVLLDLNTTLNASSTLQMDSGEVTFNGAGLGSCTGNLYGGTFLNRTNLGFSTVHVRRGSTLKKLAAGTVANLFVYEGGIFDASQSLAFAVTNGTAYRGATILDPNDQITWTNGLDVYGCRLGDITWLTGEHKTYTPSAI